jgi:hypothetical protein
LAAVPPGVSLHETRSEQEETMATKTGTLGIMAESAGDTRDEVIELLTKAYWMEIETVMRTSSWSALAG